MIKQKAQQQITQSPHTFLPSTIDCKINQSKWVL